MEAKKSHNLQSTRWGTKAPHLNTGNNGHPSPRKRNSPCLHLVVQSGLHIGEGPSLPSASRAKRSPLPQVDTPRNNVYQLSGAPPWPVKSTHKINPRTDKIQILNLILRKCQTHKWGTFYKITGKKIFRSAKSIKVKYGGTLPGSNRWKLNTVSNSYLYSPAVRCNCRVRDI